MSYNPMNTRYFLAAVVSMMLAFAIGPAHAQQGASTPTPVVVVLDTAAVLRQSAAGKDIERQVEEFNKKIEAELKAEAQRINEEGKNLQQQVAILSPELREQKQKEFNAKQQAFQTKVQNKQNEVQAAVFRARKVLDDALAPILEAIMVERGANLLLERTAVVYSRIDIDVTPIAIQRLDQKLPSVKMELAAVQR